MTTNTETLNQFTVNRDGQLDQEWLEAQVAAERRVQFQTLGVQALNGLKQIARNTGIGALKAYGHMYDDLNGTNTTHEIFG